MCACLFKTDVGKKEKKKVAMVLPFPFLLTDSQPASFANQQLVMLLLCYYSISSFFSLFPISFFSPCACILQRK